MLRLGIILMMAEGCFEASHRTNIFQQSNIDLILVDGSRFSHLAAIRTHALDIAFLPGNAAYDGFDHEAFWKEQVQLAISRTHRFADRERIDRPELTALRFLVCRDEPGPEVRRCILQRAEAHGYVPEIRHEDVGQETLMNLVAMGRGVTPVAEAWKGVSLPDLILLAIDDEADIVPFSAYWSPANDIPVLRRFLSLVRAEVKRHGALSAPSQILDPSP